MPEVVRRASSDPGAFQTVPPTPTSSTKLSSAAGHRATLNIQNTLTRRERKAGSINVKYDTAGSEGLSTMEQAVHFMQAVDKITDDKGGEGGDAAVDDSVVVALKTALVDGLAMSKERMHRLRAWLDEVEVAIDHRDARMGTPSSRSRSDEYVSDEDLVVGAVITEQASPRAGVLDCVQPTGGVLVYGGIAMDIISEVDHFPKPNSTLEANAFWTAPGGKGANAAVACGKLGTSTFMVGRVGADDFGRELLKQLEE
jgi:hypothetical protein